MSEESQPDRDPDFDRIVEELARQESARRRKTLITALILVALGVASLGAAIFWRDALHGPAIDVEAGEAEVLLETNDPQCREFIADVTAEGVSYKNIMPALQNKMIADEPVETQRLIDEIEALRKRLADAYATSADANLRYPESRQELNDWFKHIDKELLLMVRLGQNKLTPDAGETFTRPTKELLDLSVLAGDDAFENFRMWHTAALHPCGEAAADEKGWTP